MYAVYGTRKHATLHHCVIKRWNVDNIELHVTYFAWVCVMYVRMYQLYKSITHFAGVCTSCMPSCPFPTKWGNSICSYIRIIKVWSFVVARLSLLNEWCVCGMCLGFWRKRSGGWYHNYYVWSTWLCMALGTLATLVPETDLFQCLWFKAKLQHPPPPFHSPYVLLSQTANNVCTALACV